MLLAADSDSQANPQQRLGREKNFQFEKVAKSDAHLAGNGDHHAAEQPGKDTTLPAEFPRHHHVGQEHDNQQQPLQRRGEHHLRADADNEKQAAPDNQRGAQRRIAGVQPQQMVTMLLA